MGSSVKLFNKQRTIHQILGGGVGKSSMCGICIYTQISFLVLNCLVYHYCYLDLESLMLDSLASLSCFDLANKANIDQRKCVFEI